MADDVLAGYTEERVAGWYGRLADKWSKEKVGGAEPLSAILLRKWVDNRDPSFKFQFDAPQHLKTSPHVLNVLKYHRDVFLTKQKARLPGKIEKWAGVVPRLQGKGYDKWDGIKALEMSYESLVEIGSGVMDIIRIQRSGTPEEKDLFASLRGFQLRSSVKVTGQKIASKVRVTFVSWSCQAKDRYDWDYSEHLTVPNPDYKSTSPDAIEPNSETIKVYHRNAERLESRPSPGT
jgi:hypothetical protein